MDGARAGVFQIRGLPEGTEFVTAASCENGEKAIAGYEEVKPDVASIGVVPEMRVRKVSEGRWIAGAKLPPADSPRMDPAAGVNGLACIKSGLTVK